jgi:uncharacterized protein with HEPN domain
LPKDDLVYAGHMLDMAREAIGLIRNKTREDFERDRALSLALTHLLQTMGEAARRVSPEFRAAHPDLPWAAIVGLRHRVVHNYMHVDLDIVWNVVTQDLAPLAAQLERFVPEKPPG